MKNETRGSLLAAFSGLFYSFVGYLGFVIINYGYSLSQMLFWRFLLASLIIYLFMIAKKEKLTLSKNVIISSLFYCLSAWIYFASASYIGTGIAMVIFFIYPLIVALINIIIFKHKFNIIYLISFALLTVGLALLLEKNEFTKDLTGISLAILSAFIYALYIQWSQKKTSSKALNGSFLVCLGSSIISGIYSLLSEPLIIPYSLPELKEFFLIAMFCTVVPIFFLLESLKYISAAKASLLSVLEPVCVVIIGVLFLNETISLTQLIGVVSILSSTILALYA